MEQRQFGRLKLYGPHPLDRDSDGHLRYPMSAVFPAYETMIVGSGLHVNLAFDFITALGEERGHPLNEEEQFKIYEDLVALILRGNHVVIRSNPDNMEHSFLAAELLEEIIPADMIRFTGRRDPKVRQAFKLRGGSWKMAPRFFTMEEVKKQIKLSLVSVGTLNRYYYKMESGGRLMTYQQFANIRDSLVNFQEFKSRICEVVDLYCRRNKQFVRELDFFMINHEKFDIAPMVKLSDYLKNCTSWGDEERKQAAYLYDDALSCFRNAVAPDFLRDDPENPLWRTYIYSELNDIPPTEESILGMSDEFKMNINWLPGCRIIEGRVVMDRQTEEPVVKLLEDFFRFYGQLDYINLGRVMQSQNPKRAAVRYREVFIAVLKQKDSEVEQIRILRKARRDTPYYLNRGFSLAQAKRLAGGYIQYTVDRREILSLLGVNTPPINYLSRPEEIPGIGLVNVGFFDRSYIKGLATDKIPDYYYENKNFVIAKSALLGEQAGLNLIVGRSDPDTGEIFFGDGDEILIFENDNHVPKNLVLADFTGAFADVAHPLGKFIPFYVRYISGMLARIRVEGMNKQGKIEVGNLFIESMRKRIERTREMLNAQSTVRGMIAEMLRDREVEVNPIMIKWEKALRRLHDLKLESFIDKMREELYRTMD
jgi:hypothetical protein